MIGTKLLHCEITGADSGNDGALYDVLLDGRFVMVREKDPTGTREIVLVQNWFEELKRLVPTK